MSGQKWRHVIKPVLLLPAVILLTTATSTAKYSGGTGEPNSPYRIETAEDLNDIGDDPNDWDDCFILVNDINMAGFTYTTALIAPDTSSSSGFQGTPFAGVFDGNDCNIVNLTVDTGGSGKDYLGLFGYTFGGVKNLGIKDVNVSGGDYSDYVGAICGKNSSGSMRKCWAGGTVSSGNDSEYIGGLCGYNYKGKLRGCYAVSSVSGRNNCTSVGGLCGGDEGWLEYCYAAGSVSGGIGSLDVGGLCGGSRVITNCYATGPVYGDSNSVCLGGLCGNNVGFIRSSYSTGTVVGGEDSVFVGGLCGTTAGGHSPSTINDCYATGSVSGANSVGGLCGINQGSINKCYACGSVTGAAGSVKIGGLCGWNNGGTISNCYFLDPNDGGGPDNGYGTPLTDEQMKQQSSFGGWDFIGEPTDGTEGLWEMPQEQGYPILSFQDPYSGGDGSPENPYRIATAADIEQICGTRIDMDQNFVLVEDIDAAGYVYARPPIGPHYYTYWGGLQVLVQIPFSGVFDGKNHKISNLTIEAEYPFSTRVGFFGYVEAGVIKNLGLENIDVNVVDYPLFIGGLAGAICDDTIITNCYSSGNISVDGSLGCIGGLVGDINDSTMVNCYSSCSVSAGESLCNVGGLVGLCRGKVLDCRASGFVGGDREIGGLCGRNDGTIGNCYAIGVVSGYSDVGGLCGDNGTWYSAGTITNSYALGAVSGRYAVGGLCGDNEGGSIVNCYAAASVSGDLPTGGLVGNDYEGLYTNCFWDSEVNPDVNGIGNGADANVVGKTTAEMQTESTYTNAGWDFVGEVTNRTEDIWRMCWDGGWYARLAWQFYEWGDFVCPDRVDLKDFSYVAACFGRIACGDSNNCDGADLDYSGIVDRTDVKILTDLWLKGRPAPGELAVPPGADFADYAKLTSRWLHQQCWLTHNCHAADLDFSGAVDWKDLKIFCEHWLEGTE